MRRRILIPATVLVAALAAACSGGGSTAPTTTPAETTPVTTSAAQSTGSQEPTPTTEPPSSESASATSQAPPDPAELGTIEPGVLQVGIYPNGMPYVGLEGDSLVGLDAEILHAAAERLGLQVQASLMDFPALLTSIQTGRLDMGLGNIGWNPDRAAAGRYTDPPFYSPVGAALKPGLQIATVDDLDGLTIGTLTGGFYTEGLRELPNVDVRVYETFDAEMLDLNLGRLDVVLYNPVSLQYLKEQRTDLEFDVVFLTPPTAEEVEERPGLSVFQPFMTGWYLGPDAETLEQALTDQILAMYQDGTLVEIIERWGGDPETMLVPQPYFAERRQGVDRPDDWQPPSIR